MQHQFKADLTDYVLDLLPPQKRAAVDAHIATCDDCRAEVHTERAIERAVGQTLKAVQIPSSARLMELMPEPPMKQPAKSAAPSFSIPGISWWQPAMALAIIIVLFMGGFSLGQGGPALILSTATSTATQTLSASAVTLTATTVTHGGDLSDGPAAYSSHTSLGRSATPVPMATPIAQLLPTKLEKIPLEVTIPVTE